MCDDRAMFDGVVMAACGVFSLLLGAGVIPLRPSQGFDPVAWRARHGRKLVLCGALAVTGGMFLMVAGQ